MKNDGTTLNMPARKALLKDLAFARSGDKGDVCNIGLMAKSRNIYKFLCGAITSEKIKEHFSSTVSGEVEIYPVPNLSSLAIVLRRSLGGGATRTLRFDQTGKSMCTALLRMELDVDEALMREAEEACAAIELEYGHGSGTDER